jgi:hypothetical protein
MKTQSLAYIQQQIQNILALVLGQQPQQQQQPPPPPSSVASGAAGTLADLWNSYGSTAIAAGTKYVQGSLGGRQPPTPPDHDPSSVHRPPPSPSPHGSFASGVDPNGPRFPVPDLNGI